MTHPSKRKGSEEERSVVNTHREWGFKARRTLESGARNDGSVTHDVDVFVFGEDKAPLEGEMKIRKNGFKMIYDWLEDLDFLTIRANNKERLYVVPESVWHELIKRNGLS